jgi:hypothetical protein
MIGIRERGPLLSNSLRLVEDYISDNTIMGHTQIHVIDLQKNPHLRILMRKYKFTPCIKHSFWQVITVLLHTSSYEPPHCPLDHHEFFTEASTFDKRALLNSN